MQYLLILFLLVSATSCGGSAEVSVDAGNQDGTQCKQSVSSSGDKVLVANICDGQIMGYNEYTTEDASELGYQW